MKLLDTDVFIDILRAYPAALQWLEELDGEEIVLPGFVAMELIQGCRDKQQLDALQAQLGKFRIIWPDADACETAMSIFGQFHLSHNLGLLDSLIGQIAIAAGVPLNSFNRRHYDTIPGLTVVEPYVR